MTDTPQVEYEEWPERADDFIVKLLTGAYEKGLVHGYTVGKGKPPVGSDLTALRKMSERVVADLCKRVKLDGTTEGNETDEA